MVESAYGGAGLVVEDVPSGAALAPRTTLIGMDDTEFCTLARIMRRSRDSSSAK